MKVTSTIRTYVEITVKEKYEERIKQIAEEYEKRKEAITKEIREAVKQCDKMILNKAAEAGFVPNNSREGFITLWNCPIIKEEEERISKQKEELRIERDNKIIEILATLELGGTKADLDKMISEL